MSKINVKPQYSEQLTLSIVPVYESTLTEKGVRSATMNSSFIFMLNCLFAVK